MCVYVYMYMCSYVCSYVCGRICACYMDVMSVLKTRDIQLSYTFSTLNSFWPFFSFWQETKDTPFSRLCGTINSYCEFSRAQSTFVTLFD